MIFNKSSDSTEPSKTIALLISEKLNAGKSVLWLVAGGSSIEVAVKVADLLKGPDLTKLNVSLTDERYGEVGHANSNWQQLLSAGFDLPGAQLHPVLDDSDMSQTTANFDDFLREKLANCDFKVGLFGMGADGHTAGVLPNSPSVGSNDMASSYLGPDYKRITMTPAAISKMDTAVVYTMGEAKKPALQQLAQPVPVGVMPAQALKNAGQLIVFSDQTPK